MFMVILTFLNLFVMPKNTFNYLWKRSTLHNNFFGFKTFGYQWLYSICHNKVASYYIPCYIHHFKWYNKNLPILASTTWKKTWGWHVCQLHLMRKRTWKLGGQNLPKWGKKFTRGKRRTFLKLNKTKTTHN